MTLNKACINELNLLKEICIEAYSLNFDNHWNAGGLEWYLDKEFSSKKLESDLKDENIAYFFINYKQKNVGFVKLIINSKLNGISENLSELEKIYILPRYKNMGIGTLALKAVINKVKDNHKGYLFLDVMDSNKCAIAFYKKFSFKLHDTTVFNAPYFKEELKGMQIMIKKIKP